MKTITNLILAVIFLTNISFAEVPKYKIDVSNLNYTSKNSLEFEIHLFNSGNENSAKKNKSDKNNDTKMEELRYSLGQYFFEFNPKILKNKKSKRINLLNSNIIDKF